MSAAREARAPRVTVVMRSKNCDWVIGQALAALFSQAFTDFELLVVDSGSTDRTLELVRAYPHRLMQIAPESYVPGPVLNAAIAAARGEIVVFQNADAVPLSPNSLGRLVAAFDDASTMAAFGRQLPRPEADPWVRREYAASFPARGGVPEWISLSLPFAAMRTRAWAELPFYKDAWASEDTAWGNAARLRGWRIAYVRDAIAMHSHNYTLRQLYGRRFAEGEADAFISRRTETLGRAAARTIRGIVKGVAASLARNEFRDACRVPARECVYHWAYLRGHQLGVRRQRSRDTSVTAGQRVVLARHESVRP